MYPRAQRLAQAGAALAAGARERARVQLVWLILAVYVLAIAEGSLRKWVLPEFASYLYFIRDPFLIAAYWLAARHGLWPRNNLWLAVTWAMFIAGTFLAVLQATVGGYSDQRLILSLHGWRSYFLYIPLAFLVGAQFNARDLRRLYRLTLWLALPIGVLVTLQFFAPPGAPINVGIASDVALQFRGLTVNPEHVRPMGPFASLAGQHQFVTTAWAILLGLLILPAKRRDVSLVLLVAAVAAIGVCVGLGGSRGMVLQCGITTAAALLFVLVGRGTALKGRATAWTVGLLVLALPLYPVLLPEGYEAFSGRWETAARVESIGIVGRAFYGLIDFLRLIEQVPLLGYGLGYGTNASVTLGARIDGVMPGLLAETDFARHMVDLGPVFGLGYMAFRLAIVAWIVLGVWRTTRHNADPMPMLLLSYVAVVLAQGQITGQGAVNVYGWLFAGVVIAASKCSTTGGQVRRPVNSRPTVARWRGAAPGLTHRSRP